MTDYKCSMCGKAMVGYWYELNGKKICADCGAVATLEKIMNAGIIDLFPKDEPIETIGVVIE